MPNHAYIAGSGIVTSIGHTVAENLASLKAGLAGIGLPELLLTQHRLPVGEIKLSNDDLGRRTGADTRLPRTALLSIMAAQEAWQPLADKAAGLRIAFISANTVGGMDLTESFYAAFRKDKQAGDLEAVRHHECGAITELTVQALGLSCWSTTISTACSSSANSIMMGAKLIENDRYDIVIAGGADSLSRFTLNGFNSLMILDKELCRPFDEHRRGLNLGEGAAYLVLAGEKAMQQLGVQPRAIVSGYANANDAHHQTASSPEGKGNQLAMKQAIAQAGIAPDQVSYINLHGTGTENNDASEGAAVQAVFDQVPPASSTKAFTGHTLGAAGAVEAVFSLLSLQEQICLPHLRMTTPISSLRWQPVTALQSLLVKHVLSNSFGFGGNCSSLVLSAV
ncbi:beta-ketoacyl-[acyl-carrier-protein] synthase family protein [Taibaiella koreensis]|uniref:beta-ketoacyl-[acyl-carrier-protein] synthase family protein n=1 Tax=Taibaiella koreensis TaxID=1268548 RepID=UPI000E59C395|nr:beta-ketoacyl-[acyl-carrier-protein] synthase family protein [Taibaiella koreensis]